LLRRERGLINLYNSERICNLQLNSSKAKQQYSFAKADRFIKREGYEWERDSEGADVIYTLPIIKNERSTSLGYGSRSDFTDPGQKAFTPSPGKYDICKGFNDRRLGRSFALGRDRVRFASMFDHILNETPGPGRYRIKEPVANNVATFKSRHKVRTYRDTYEVPGPGKYSIEPLLNKSGVYISSQHKNCSSPKLIKKKNKSRTADASVESIPGPGQYDQICTLNKEGDYVIGHFENTKKVTFGKAKKTLTIKSDGNIE